MLCTYHYALFPLNVLLYNTVKYKSRVHYLDTVFGLTTSNRKTKTDNKQLCD